MGHTHVPRKESPKDTEVENLLSSQPFDESRWRILSCDGGLVNMATVVEIVLKGEGNRLGKGPRGVGKPTTYKGEEMSGREAARLSHPDNPRGERVAVYVLRRGEFDRQSGKEKSLALSAKWRKEVAAEHDLLSTVSRKTLRLDRLAAYHAVVDSTADKCWANRSKTRIARQAFGVWSRSTALMDKFWAGILRGRERDGTTGMEERTILGYGDWAFKKGVGGGAKRLRESALRVFRAHGRGRVLIIDEYKTSKTCHSCGSVLRDLVDTRKNRIKGAHPGNVDRGFKHCEHRKCLSFLDRDVNGALNIRKATITRLRREERPSHLLRESVPITRETASTEHGAPKLGPKKVFAGLGL